MEEGLLMQFGEPDIPPPVVLMRLEFSPTALRLDKYASTFGEASVMRYLLHNAARLISSIADHSVVELKMGNEEQVGPYSPTIEDFCDEWDVPVASWVMSEIAVTFHRFLLKGNDIQVSDVPSVLLLLWSLNNSRGLIEVVTALKRAVPNVKLSIEESIDLPMAYALFRTTTYIPPADLIILSKSVVHLRLR